MVTMTLDLPTWLRIQLDADEKAQHDSDDSWHDSGCESVPSRWRLEIGPCDCGVPARVLAEVAAKRTVLGLHAPVPLAERIFRDVDSFLCAVCTDGSKLYDQQRGVLFTDLTVYPCETLRLLARPYAGRDGYDEGWKP